MKRYIRMIAICAVTLLVVHAISNRDVFGITIKEEEELSKEYLKIIKKRLTLIRDPVIVGYVEKVGRNILANVPPQPFKYHFYVVQQHVYNAFATPAGHIFINSGLVEALENEDELAGILAHEIAHVVCRHISQHIERSPKIGLATLAGIAAGIFIGAGGAAALGNAVAVGSMAAGQSVSLAYSREDEMQADQLALDYLRRSGYRVEGLLTSLQKMRSKQWFGTEQVPDYLMTHPASEDRMAYIDTYLQRSTLPESQRRVIKENDFRLVQATIFGKYSDENNASARFEAQLKVSPEDAIVHYGYALLLARMDAYEASVSHLRKALEKDALNPVMLKELGRIYFLEGQYEKAFNALKGSVSLSPNDNESMFYLARTYLELGKLEEAAGVFNTILERDSENMESYRFLGNIYGKLENLGEAHYYLGIYNKMKGRLKTATFHLEKALKIVTDTKRKEEIEALLKKVEKEVRKAARESHDE